ncbi:hypothetical protein AX15_003570 [Amanita polypyramis BW_CC]|nr:hypothetical protein AX15_003570 [Amanita polypyramis BW_CC]
MEAAAAKKAEFARLFQRLTNRKSHVQVPSGKSRTFAAPPDLALPTIHNFRSIVSSKAQQRDIEEAPFTGIPRSNVTAVTQLTTGESTVSKGGGESADKFPVGESYPFTFKMMLHKLYELEEWAKKVKDVLERSQEDYKPLCEVDWERKRASVDDSQLGHVQLRLGKQQGGRRRGYSVPNGGLPIGHTRNDSTSDNAPAEKVRRGSVILQAAPESPKVYEGENIGGNEARAIKKRCVGRDKLVTGNPQANTDDYKPERTWVYNSAVALVGLDDVERRTGTNGHARKSSLVTFQLSEPGNEDGR